jgi:NADPH-dependent ferric siderophore reductase
MAERTRFPARSGTAELTARRALTPRMVRITLRAADFGPGWPIQQPGEIVTLLFLSPAEEVVLPVEHWRFPAGVQQEWRNYTVRRHDPEAGEIDVDVVVHEPRGPACTWALETPLGGRVGYAGPRVDFTPRADAQWLLLCGDETALPAIAAILEAERVPERVLALVEVAGPAEQHALDVPAGAQLHWVHRDGAPAATTTHLADALRAVPLPDGPGQVWGAAESRVARDVRDVLRGERGLPRKHVKATGYWLRTGDWILDGEA